MKKEVAMNSTEWDHLDRQIQVTTGKSSIKLISAFKFEDNASYSDNGWMKSAKDKTWIDAVLNITDFSKEYYRQVLSKQVALQDLIIYAGHVNIHKFTSQAYKIFTFLICKVCLGTAGTPATPKVENCDSIIIAPEKEQTFQYNFFLKQHWQYQPCYEVNFTVSDDREYKLSQFSCCNCQNKPPSIFCSTESLNFCQECCNDHHRPKLMHSHNLQAIDKINTLENCRTHNLKYEMYCLKCEKYLCTGCVQKGVHAQGTDHVIKPIRYYYAELDENIDVLPVKSLQKIKVLLYNLSIKRKEIQDNQKEIKQQIDAEYKKCIKMLEEETAKKYQMLDSNELELNLLKQKIQWSQSFSVFQSNALKPIYFFKSQSIFEEEIKKLKVADFDSILSCKPDLVYQGFNSVGTKQTVDKSISAIKKSKQVEMLKKDESRIRKQNQAQFSQNQRKIRNILAFDNRAEAPPKGSLLTEIQKCDLKFFQLRAK